MGRGGAAIGARPCTLPSRQDPWCSRLPVCRGRGGGACTVWACRRAVRQPICIWDAGGVVAGACVSIDFDTNIYARGGAWGGHNTHRQMPKQLRGQGSQRVEAGGSRHGSRPRVVRSPNTFVGDRATRGRYEGEQSTREGAGRKVNGMSKYAAHDHASFRAHTTRGK